MNHKMFTERFQLAIPSYKKMLLNDFDRFPMFEQLSSQLCFGVKDKIKPILKNSEVHSLDDLNKPHQVKFILPRFETMDGIDYQFTYFNPQDYDRYFLFDKLYFNKSDEYNEIHKPGEFYFCRKDLINVLDALFVKHMKGFEKNGKKKWIKKISDDLFLGIDFTRSSLVKPSIEDYTPPILYLNYKTVDYLFSFDLMTFKYLFLNFNSFVSFFYYNKTIQKSSEEPVVYKIEDTGQLLYTNSIPNIDRFNKFIFINAEIHTHYCLLFQRWLIDDFLPGWLLPYLD
jgi:hypothetical protein